MKKVSITLSHDDIGQVLDGLRILIEQWEATATYLETGEVTENACIRESHSVHEAKSIAGIYHQILECIREQLPAN